MKLGETGEPFNVVAKLLVGADGLRSRVREQLTRELGHSTVLRRLGVSVILGIAKLDAKSGLLHNELFRKGGFYVLDSGHRLFTMPFDSSN